MLASQGPHWNVCLSDFHLSFLTSSNFPLRNNDSPYIYANTTLNQPVLPSFGQGPGNLTLV